VVGATLALGLGLLIADAMPAHACSCDVATASQQFDGADVVFVGEMTEATGVGSTTNQAYFRFAVDRVFKGAVGTEMEIQSPSQGGACGLTPIADEPFLVFASDEPRNNGVMRASTCNGSRPVQDAPLEGFGPGEPPDPEVALPAHREAPRVSKAAYALVLAGLAGAGVVVAVGLRVRRTA
jgi:hypothetical protein